MTDADVCAPMSLGEPTISLTALAELRAFLDSALRSQEHTTEHADAQAGLESGSASGSPNNPAGCECYRRSFELMSTVTM
jgi:hypothetical protein